MDVYFAVGNNANDKQIMNRRWMCEQEMKKKILIGSIFAVLLMLARPCISAVNVQATEMEMNEKLKTLDGYRLEGLKPLIEGLGLLLKTPLFILISPILLTTLMKAGFNFNQALSMTLLIVFSSILYIKCGIVMMIKNIPIHEVNTPFFDVLSNNIPT